MYNIIETINTVSSLHIWTDRTSNDWRPRPDATKCDIWSESTLSAYLSTGSKTDGTGKKRRVAFNADRSKALVSDVVSSLCGLVATRCVTCFVCFLASCLPSEQMTFIQRRINVDATSWRCIDVDSTLSQRGVPAGLLLPLFHNVFNISNFRSQITYSFVKCGCSIYFFLNSANLICRCTK